MRGGIAQQVIDADGEELRVLRLVADAIGQPAGALSLARSTASPNRRGVSSAITNPSALATGTAFDVARDSGRTWMMNRFGVGSWIRPPSTALPLSRTWNWTLA
jgi:hypothetical protein